MTVLVGASPPSILQFFDNRGNPCAGGSVLTQVSNVNYATYQDAAGATPLPNPIPLNSRGEISNASGVSCQLFLVQGVVYTFTLFDSAGNQLNQAINVQTEPQAYALSTALAAPSGSSLVGFIQAGTGAGPRTMQAKSRDIVCILDFYANGSSGAMVDPTFTVDSTLGIQAAYNTHASVFNPPGSFKITAKPRFQVDGQHSYGCGGCYGATQSVTEYKYAGAADESQACISFRPAATGRHVSECELRDIGLNANNLAGMCVEVYDIKNNPGAGYQGTWRNELLNVHCKYATMLGIQWGGSALITCIISWTSLTVTANVGRLSVGQTVAAYGPGTALTSGTAITALIGGTGGTGTYTVNHSQTVGSQAMIAASGAPNFSNDW